VYFIGDFTNTSLGFTFSHGGTGNLHLAGHNWGMNKLIKSAAGTTFIDSNTALPTNVTKAAISSFDTVLASVSNLYNPTYIEPYGGQWFNAGSSSVIEWGTGTVVTSVAARTWTINGNGTLIFRGAMTATAAGINKAGTGTLLVYGPWLSGTLESDMGTTTVYGAYSGGTCVTTNGTINLVGAYNGGSITVNGSGVLNMSGPSGSGSVGVSQNGAAYLSGNYSGGSLSLNLNAIVVISGTFSPTGTITHAGTGVLSFNSNGAFGTGIVFNSSSAPIDNTSGAAVSNNQVTTFQVAQSFVVVGSNPIDFGTGRWHWNTKGITVNAGTHYIRGDMDATAGNQPVKSGSGGLVLTASNSMVMGWLVSAGTLWFNGDMTTTPTNSVASGATAAGTGIVRGLLSVGSHGSLYGGGTNGCGALIANGNITFASQATNIINVLNSTTYSSIIQSNGVFSLTAGGQIKVLDTGATLSGSDVLTIWHPAGGSRSGTYSGQAEGATVAGQKYNYTISYIGGGGGGDITLTRQ